MRPIPRALAYPTPPALSPVVEFATVFMTPEEAQEVARALDAAIAALLLRGISPPALPDATRGAIVVLYQLHAAHCEAHGVK